MISLVRGFFVQSVWLLSFCVVLWVEQRGGCFSVVFVQADCQNLALESKQQFVM